MAGGGGASAPLPRHLAIRSADGWKLSVHPFSYVCIYCICLFMTNNTPGLVYGCSTALVLNIPVAETANVNLKTKPLQVLI